MLLHLCNNGITYYTVHWCQLFSLCILSTKKYNLILSFIVRNWCIRGLGVDEPSSEINLITSTSTAALTPLVAKNHAPSRDMSNSIRAAWRANGLPHHLIAARILILSPLSPAVTFVRLRVLLLLSDTLRRRRRLRAGIFYRRLATMSSLLKPFSVCEGPCDSCGLGRGGCPSSANQQPPCRRLAAAAAVAKGLGSLPAHQRSYAFKRNLAAAAIGGRKITHPGKAILAG